jgi:predicted transcriptional regulator
MAERTIYGDVDDEVAKRLKALAREESRSPAEIVNQALAFYLGLPEAARAPLRRVATKASAAEWRWLQTEVTRLLVKADMAATQRKMAEEMGGNIPDAETEEDLERVSVEWTNAPGSKGS